MSLSSVILNIFLEFFLLTLLVFVFPSLYLPYVDKLCRNVQCQKDQIFWSEIDLKFLDNMLSTSFREYLPSPPSQGDKGF